jgi:hypothetical protein
VIGTLTSNARPGLSPVGAPVTSGVESFPDNDAVRRAVSELVGAGLLHRLSAFVLPTRVALYFSRLEVD